MSGFQTSLSVDLGFGFVKAVAEYMKDGKLIRKKISFPALVKRKESNNGFSGFLGVQDDYLVEAFNVATDGVEGTVDAFYYTGDSAITNSGKRKWTEKGEFNKEDLTVLLGTATALLIPDEYEIDVLHVGLPMNYFQDSAEKLYDHIEEINATVKVNGNVRHVKFNTIEVKPQGVGAYFDVIYDWNGRIRNAELAQSSIGIILIGYRTLEYLLAKSGRNGVQFIDDKSGSLEKEGMNKFLSVVQAKILSQYSIEIPKEFIERAIFFDDCLLDTKHGKKNISRIVEEAKASYVAEVVGAIKPIWGSDEETLRSVFIGGGSAKYLFDDFQGSFVNLVLHGDEVESEKREEAHIYANANGFLKMQKASQL